jgi:hypothetical protein
VSISHGNQQKLQRDWSIKGEKADQCETGECGYGDNP